jgi:hypothetical protein
MLGLGPQPHLTQGFFLLGKGNLNALEIGELYPIFFPAGQKRIK